jgi:ribosomal protein L13E
MNTCDICGASFPQPKNARHKITCSPQCYQIRKKELGRKRNGITLNEYDKLGLKAVEAVKGLEPVSRRKRSIIMENFLGNLMSLEDEAAMVFAEASTWGRGIQVGKEGLL